MKNKAKAFIRLVEIMDRLRVECPWDKKQTIDSLRYLTIEEMYELYIRSNYFLDNIVAHEIYIMDS